MTLNLLENLNPAQKAAVKYIDGPLLVLAGAGSGKTSVITRKISWLISQCDVPAHKITAVTFTNKAAKEMKARVSSLLPKGAGKGLKISTFHQFGLRIIREEVRNCNRKPGFTILDDQDTKSILKDLLINDATSDTDLLDLIQQQISKWKNDSVAPKAAQSLAESPQEARFVRIYEKYERALASYNAVDFDDLIRLPVKLLTENTEARARWQNRVHYLLVDEYQDTNQCQYQLVKLIVEGRDKLVVVGDDDQSIYTWRGADPKNLSQLSEDFHDLKVIKLEQNYRSTNRILRSANQLISENTHIFDKKLWSDKGLGDPIHIVGCANDDAECEHIANAILDGKLKYNANFSDFAVLTRSNHLSKLLEIKLQAKMIPYNLVGGTSFFSRNEIKDVMAYLRLLINPDDDAAFLRIVNVPRRKIGSATLEKLGQYAGEREIGLFSAIGEVGLTTRLAKNNLARLTTLSEWFDNLQHRLTNENAKSVVASMVDDIDYHNWLMQNSSSASIAEKRMENVYLLLTMLNEEIERQRQEEKDPSSSNFFEDKDELTLLENAINKILLRDLLEQQSEESADNRVQILTMHASKGLEFPHVIIMGFEEGILPHRNSIDEDNVEEERRLAYVAITRAQKTLLITLCKQRKSFGEHLNCEPSRFMAELPQEDIVKSGFGETLAPEKNEAKGKETLSNLRALFDN